MIVRVALTTCLGLSLLARPESSDITVYFPPRTVDFSLVTAAKKQKELGADLDRLFAFVRDEVRHDVYSGVLRDETEYIAITSEKDRKIILFLKGRRLPVRIQHKKLFDFYSDRHALRALYKRGILKLIELPIK